MSSLPPPTAGPTRGPGYWTAKAGRRCARTEDVLAGLSLEEDSEEHLRELTAVLDATWKQMAERLEEAGADAKISIEVQPNGRAKLNVQYWGKGLLAAVDGLRFVVRVRTISAAPSPKYFAKKRGITWLNAINDQVIGIGRMVVPGTPRDSLFILDALLNLDGGVKPEMVATDNASYSTSWAATASPPPSRRAAPCACCAARTRPDSMTTGTALRTDGVRCRPGAPISL
ncbi:Tn3 family transposase [Streptomyces sp. NBC_01296]|nr:Tn3 family transposase [Streptomyces sp. NBC_01296]